MAAITLSYDASCVNRLHDRRTLQRLLSAFHILRYVSRIFRKIATVILFGALLTLPVFYFVEVL